eukprot:TRINITY_DN5484_c0_g1_i7.p1 TRINITY_DN5484_c0_g1~~TRINITY_DN5484_c0_g1_i7.p1  ORF type:complete len:423 (-),score=84.07 TRINITY_DN5484_c0_g1_i7:84-1352(-)
MPPCNTPPPSPGISNADDGDDELYEDEVLEEVPVDENGAPPLEDEENISDEDDLVELPGGIDQLESIMETMQQAKDNSIAVFKDHGKAVFSCAFHPELENVVVSGGEDDAAYIWDPTNTDSKQKLDDWRDSVNCVTWSNDGQHLAACDMAGNIKVFKYPGLTVEWSFEVGDINWLKWHPVANVLFAGTADSEMWMWKIPSGDSKLFQGQGEKTECGEILADGKRAVCGYSDGSLRQFDLKSGNTVNTFPKGLAHIDVVNCVSGHMNNTLFLSGSMDGTAKLWNSTSGKVVGTLLCGAREEENSSSSVECAIFPRDKSTTYCVTGTLDGIVTVWDTPTQISRHACKVGDGVSKVDVHKDGNLVFASTLDGAVKCLDLRTGNAVMELSGHSATILDFSLSSSGSHLVTSSDDGTCRIYNVRENS